MVAKLEERIREKLEEPTRRVEVFEARVLGHLTHGHLTQNFFRVPFIRDF